MENKSNLTAEWKTLQNQYDSYEKFSLLIKLVCLSVVSYLYVQAFSACFIIFIIAVFWLQDAIWKTFQSRIEERLLSVENSIKYIFQNHEQEAIIAYQFNQSFLENRPSSSKLLLTYLKQALRPTIAFPYIVIILATISVNI